MCFVYILYSDDLGKFYVGHCCEDPQERLRKHLSNHKGFSSRAKDWQLVFLEEYSDKTSAYRREREIKSWKSSIKIRELISSAG